MSSLDELTGQTIAGRYQLLEQIKSSDASSEYRATDLTNQAPVRLKLLSPCPVDPNEFESAFLRQAEKISRISHTNIIELSDYGTHQGSPSNLQSFEHLRSIMTEQSRTKQIQDK